MTIEKINNEGSQGYLIIDEEGSEYFVVALDEQTALEKCNKIKERQKLSSIPSYKELRKNEYPSLDEMTVALWEKIIEGRSDESERLQAIRETVKAKYPK